MRLTIRVCCNRIEHEPPPPCGEGKGWGCISFLFFLAAKNQKPETPHPAMLRIASGRSQLGPTAVFTLVVIPALSRDPPRKEQGHSVLDGGPRLALRLAGVTN